MEPQPIMAQRMKMADMSTLSEVCSASQKGLKYLKVWFICANSY